MLRIAKYTTWDALQELRLHWNDLLSHSSSNTVFLTWQWCEAWWKNYGAGRELFVLGVFDGDELVGVAPLYVDLIRRLGKKWRRLLLIGDGSHDSDYLDLLVSRSREREVVLALAGALETDREWWDWIELNGARKGSSCTAALVGCLHESGWTFRTEPVAGATLRLPGSWEEYLRTLEPRVRTKVRSALGSLSTAVRSTPIRCNLACEIDEWLSALFDLHTRRWQNENMPGVFQDPRKRAFYRDLSRAAMEQGWLAFHRLNWGERPLALQYGLVYRNCFHLLQEGYDPEFSVVRPGVALRAWLLRHWIESGLEEYDFLAGASRHKLDWGAIETVAERVCISAKPVAKTVCLTFPSWTAEIRERIASRTPDAILLVRRRILSASARSSLRPSSVAALSEGGSARGMMRKFVSRAYSSTPFGAAGSALATNYVWRRSNANGLIPIHRRSRPVLHIFQYHRVNDERDPFLGGLSVETFRTQMQYLARTFPLVTLDQFYNRDFTHQDNYCIAVTFDDGYRDNFVCAFPILKQLGIPATVFLATGYIDGERIPWYDQVRLAFKLTKRSRFTAAELGGPGGSLDPLPSRLRLMQTTLDWLREMQDAARRLALTELFRALGVPSDLSLPNQMLRWEDIRQMSRGAVCFGGHTVTHPVLSKVTATELKAEIEGSKRTIENRLQQSVSHFAYPFGQARDFDSSAKNAVRTAGFKTAVTTIRGLNEAQDDPFELKRFTPWEADLAEFKLKLDWFRFSEPRHADSVSTRHGTETQIAQEARA